MRSAAVLAPAMLSRCSVSAVASAGVAAAPARSFFTHLRGRCGLPPQPACSVSALAASPALSAVPRRFMSSEPKIKRVRQAWEDDDHPAKVVDDTGRPLYGERAREYLAAKAEEAERARVEAEASRTTMTVQEDKQKGTRDQEEILRILTKFKLQDHAEKFFSMQNLLNVNVRQLKEMGLTVKQRKTLLRAIGKYRLALRVKKANELIYGAGASMEPAQLQQAVYNILYAPIYAELEWREARAPLIAAWRADIAKYKSERLQNHSQMRGLREPELMEIAKVEAHMMAETLKWKRAGYEKQSERFEREGLREDGTSARGRDPDDVLESMTEQGEEEFGDIEEEMEAEAEAEGGAVEAEPAAEEAPKA